MWRKVASFIISLYGVGASSYLTAAHFSQSLKLSCPETGVINCEAVTTSPQSYFLHIPVSVLGLAYFVVLAIFCFPLVWNLTSKWVAILRMVLVSGGLLFALYLVSQELLVIHAICLWCTSVHVATLILFVIVMTGWSDTGYGALELS